MQIELTELRRLEEQRLAPALEGWNQAKTQLENAIAQAEASEREYHTLSQEVQRRLAALSVVVEMSRDLLPANADGPQAAPAPVKPLTVRGSTRTSELGLNEEPNGLAERKSIESAEKSKGFLGASSRQLFPAAWRERAKQAVR